jgi:hypothetical protein
VAAQDNVGDQAGPAGLVEGADRGAVVAVEARASTSAGLVAIMAEARDGASITTW